MPGWSRTWASETRDWISGVLGHHLIGVFIGTGGNVETIGDLSGRRAGKMATSYAYLGDIDRTRLELEALGFEGRRRELGLKQDRGGRDLSRHGGDTVIDERSLGGDADHPEGRTQGRRTGGIWRCDGARGAD